MKVKQSIISILMMITTLFPVISNKIGNQFKKAIPTNYTGKQVDNLSETPFGLSVLPFEQTEIAIAGSLQYEFSKTKLPQYQPFYARSDEAQQLGFFINMSSEQLQKDPLIQDVSEKLQANYSNFLNNSFVIQASYQENPKILYRITYQSETGVIYEVLAQILSSNKTVKLVQIEQKNPKYIPVSQTPPYLDVADDLLKAYYKDFIGYFDPIQANYSLSLNSLRYLVKYQNHTNIYLANVLVSISKPAQVKILSIDAIKQNNKIKYLNFSPIPRRIYNTDEILREIDNYAKRNMAGKLGFRPGENTAIVMLKVCPGKSFSELNYMITYLSGEKITEIGVSYFITTSRPRLLYMKTFLPRSDSGDSFKQIDFISVWSETYFQRAIKKLTQSNPSLASNDYIINRVETSAVEPPKYRITFYLVPSGNIVVLVF